MVANRGLDRARQRQRQSDHELHDRNHAGNEPDVGSCVAHLGDRARVEERYVVPVHDHRERTVVGTGPPSVASKAVTPVGPPGAPTRLHASFTNGAVTVSWVAAAANGAPITSYAVGVTPGGKTFTVAGSQTHVTITGLGAGAYTFRARATNAAGPGSWSSPTSTVTIAVVQSAFRYTARYSAAQYAYMTKTAAHFHLAVQDVPKTGVAVLAYILTISRHAPTKPIGHVSNAGPNAITTTYTSATNSSTMVPVERYIVENGDDTLYVGGLLMEYLAAIAGVR